MKKLLSAGAVAALTMAVVSTGAEAQSMQDRCLAAAAAAGIGADYSVVYDAARAACVATPLPGTAAAAGLGALGPGGAAAAAVGGLALIVAVASTGGT